MLRPTPTSPVRPRMRLMSNVDARCADWTPSRVAHTHTTTSLSPARISERNGRNRNVADRLFINPVQCELTQNRLRNRINTNTTQSAVGRRIRMCGRGKGNETSYKFRMSTRVASRRAGAPSRTTLIHMMRPKKYPPDSFARYFIPIWK